MIELLLIGFMMGLDNFRVAVALGPLNFSRRRRMQVAFAFCLCEMLAPVVGLSLGKLLIESIRPWVAVMGPIVLGGTGLCVIYQAVRNKEDHSPFDHGWIIFGLPISLSFDNFLAGTGLGMLGLPILLSAIVIGLMSGMLCILGLFLGRAIAGYLSSRAELLSGVLLLVVAAALVISA